MNAVSYTSAGRKALRSLSSEAQERVKAAMALYAETGQGDVAKLKGGDGYRLRIGGYRVLCTLPPGEVRVHHAGPREVVYKSRRQIMIQIIKTDGEDLVVLTRSAYEALVADAHPADEPDEDAAASRIIRDSEARIARGEDLALPGEVWDAIEQAPHPLGPLRRWRGLTQQQLAEAAGISQPAVSGLEAGRKSASPAVLSKLASVLHVPIGHLIPEAEAN